jgi:hypothetical protein
MLKQLSEILDLVRSVAGGCLERLLLSASTVVPFIPQKLDLMEAMKLNAQQTTRNIAIDNNYGAPSITFPMVVKAMNIDTFFEDIVSDIVISVGGITESVVEYASLWFLEWAKVLKPSEAWKLFVPIV